jgi:transposase
METATTGSSISRFMRWAEEKIAQAVKEDEEFVAKSGTNNFLKSDAYRPCSRKLEDSEKKQIVLHIHELRDMGMKTLEACESTRVHYSTYRKWMINFDLKYKKGRVDYLG